MNLILLLRLFDRRIRLIEVSSRVPVFRDAQQESADQLSKNEDLLYLLLHHAPGDALVGKIDPSLLLNVLKRIVEESDDALSSEFLDRIVKMGNAEHFLESLNNDEKISRLSTFGGLRWLLLQDSLSANGQQVLQKVFRTLLIRNDQTSGVLSAHDVQRANLSDFRGLAYGEFAQFYGNSSFGHRRNPK